MIIVSKFHDFYDHGMGLAGYSADDVRFVRQREEVDDAQKRFGRDIAEPMKLPQQHMDSRLTLLPFTVAFCGKLYRGVQVGERSNLWTHWYDGNLLLEYVRVRYRKRYAESFEKFFDGSQYHWRNEATYSSFLDISKQGEDIPRLRNACIAAKITILVHRRFDYAQSYDAVEWVLNRELKDLEFYRVVEPFQAFQMISQWVGGVLIQPDRPMITVSDAVKIHKRGFDKWSFRRPPRG